MAVISQNRKTTLARNSAPVRTPPTESKIWSRVAGFAAAFVAGALVAGGLVFALTRPDPTEAAIQQIRAEDAQRDKAQIKELTDLARGTRDRLNPVVEGLGRAMPAANAEEPAGPAVVTPADVEKWRTTMATALAGFADPPSGQTATNVARASLTSAVKQLATAVDTYAAARDLSGPAAATVTDLAARQRSDAVFTWSVGATALDAVNVDAGYGHQHVHLQTTADGALTPDDEPEGHQ
ncbi:hypothetical protein Sme01_68930 [Sphaerisporangium melleum]|uniref:hypothetical protein n=1 Tax=Sphaerisporangium melleum TaxID=321316 RepID=UPI001667A958|nr:hypothetical protein [Sphaerisporangium melleum]GII74417.1 hypothetical protein Sme01_68930 [Sphaerisporangium melleum]